MEDFIIDNLERSFKKHIDLMSELQGSKVLITGGSGYMGGWVTCALTWLNDTKGLDCKIILLSKDKNTIKNVPFDREHVNIEYIYADIRGMVELPQDIDYIIHTVGNPDTSFHASNPVETIDVISKGTQNVLDAATRISSLKKIIHISSGQVETTTTPNFHNNVSTSYVEAKRFSEAICGAYKIMHKLPITIVRPFSFIGPYHDIEKPWALNSFINDAINGGPIRIHGNGKPVRSFLYATDMAVWLLVFLLKGQKGEIYNLGSSEEISLQELATKISNVTLQSIDVVVENYNDKISTLVPALEKEKNLGLGVCIDINEAVLRTIEWNLKRRNKSL